MPKKQPSSLAAIGKLDDSGDIGNLVIARCTGSVAPGIDQIAAHRLDLADDGERALTG
ncbi:hypothetical protein [Qipengyuania flava]|uniref:hypothetical protein n=1 Tax=Qipengyuania flava TaxID=192812 RepID=UPI00178C7B75|nr:hypothetical protein [Qipengyuania flava]